MEEIKNGSTRYSPNQGDQTLVEAIAKKYNVNSNRVIITIGAEQGLFASMFATLSKGDSVAFLTPSYPAYEGIATMLGARSIFIKNDAHGRPDLKDLKRALSKARVLVCCSPNNPDGRVLTKEEVDNIACIAKEHKTLIIADECYEFLSFKEHTSFLSTNAQVIKLSSASKQFSATGIRVGWMVVPDGWKDQFVKIQNMSITCAPVAEQRAVAQCITNHIEYTDMRHAFKTRSARACSILDRAGIPYIKPEGAFYLFVKVPTDDYAFCIKLAQEKGILIVPGSAFGNGKGFVRISLTATEKEIIHGMEQITEFILGEQNG